ncbi:heterokaryon incompatibility protein-domain-containing protein, partial [Amylocarpus encephaloides]
MRLLNCLTLEFCEVFENAKSTYAILSHTWGLEEVTFQDMLNNKGQEKAGYIKVKLCCKQAMSDGFNFVWIDTCCIDKTSSAELSEAINSMMVWYQKSTICYAFLSDVTLPLSTDSLVPSADDEQYSEFATSRWFTRGWTLQELLAPSDVRFYDKYWRFLGTKSYLGQIISKVTGIDEDTLKGRDLREVSVAKRMSWASHRVTSRVEDIAYCLIGIFGVNLPLLYGEGEHAFIRLQEEIMKSSDDQSLFAWEDPAAIDNFPLQGGFKIVLGFLARSPAEFENAGLIVPYRNWEISTPYSMTNQGLRIELEVLRYEDSDDYIGILGCHFDNSFLGPLGIYIIPIISAQGDQFARDAFRLKPVIVIPEHVARATLRTIYIRQEIVLPSARDYDRTNRFLIRSLPEDKIFTGEDYTLDDVQPKEDWNEDQNIL